MKSVYRKSILIASFITLFLLACNATFTVGYPTPSKLPPTQIPTATPVPLSQQVTLVSQPYIETNQDPVFTITSQTPQLSGNTDPRVQAFNEKLDDLVQNEVAMFRQEFIKNPVLELSTSSFLEVTYALISQYDDVWSFKFDFFFYNNGAAHPGNYSITLNYDLAQNKELALGDLFLPNSNYLEVISNYSISELRKQPYSDVFTMEGAKPTLENYRNWNITPEGLMVTFDTYQVAPGAAGLQVVVVPYDQLQAVIDRQGVLKNMIQ